MAKSGATALVAATSASTAPAVALRRIGVALVHILSLMLGLEETGLVLLLHFINYSRKVV